MTVQLSPANLLALFGAMAVLAAVPSVSVLAVTARAAALGFAHGVYTTLGIVAGDIVFILIAVLGLAVLAETFGDWFFLVRYAGGLYLIFIGVVLWRSAPSQREHAGESITGSPLASVLVGLFITLGDQKAILFYLGFFPAFIDLAALSVLDVGLVMLTATVTLVGVKLVYAGLAARAGLRLGPAAGRWMNRLAGGVMVVVGLWLFRP